MIKRVSDMRCEVRENVRGGTGALAMQHLLDADELLGFGKMAAKFTIQKGQSIGRHPHDEDGELYIILSGRGLVDDNGTMHEVSAGDVVWTAKGEFHSITNEYEEPLCLYAIVIDQK